VSVEAVKWHLRNTYTKLHVHSRMEAAAKLRSIKPA
jgi:ATP/maltotriose-dependent transcriptional regulator MalT